MKLKVLASGVFFTLIFNQIDFSSNLVAAEPSYKILGTVPLNESPQNLTINGTLCSVVVRGLPSQNGTVVFFDTSNVIILGSTSS
jgi:hypothetical protein